MAGSQGHSTRLGRRMHVELATAPRIMRRGWFSASLHLGRRPNTCGAGNSTTDYATLVFSVAPPWPTHQHMWSWQQHHGLCDIFSVALSWPTSHICGAGCMNFLLFAVLLAPLIGSVLVSITPIYLCLFLCSIVIV
jgi:hypothetical protein